VGMGARSHRSTRAAGLQVKPYVALSGNGTVRLVGGHSRTLARMRDGRLMDCENPVRERSEA
jgi:hypothetical protein